MNLHKEEDLRKIVIGIAMIACLLAGLWIISSQNKEIEPEPTKTSPFSENCTFYKKVMGGDFTISEPSAGTFRYEIYATSEGIEVWKCNNF